MKAARVEASKRLLGQQGGDATHPRCALPFSPMTMAVGGFILVVVITYFTLHAKKKLEASTIYVANVAARKTDLATTQVRERDESGADERETTSKMEVEME
uniref:Transmembrane protein n=1 Tax=Nelumbo nucifera TaxID=4432 RepID=A0A822YH13_NELNU|nr:TPA_asm: hypothetical protein HUJ06_030226 [Nelumbo nucifera]DAD28759.1 TPA_asm: hypothetical protein HUJ06_030227 [Nelumbo nucifera]